MFCVPEVFEGNASDIVTRISREEYTKLLKSIQTMCGMNLSAAFAEMTMGELALTHLAAAYPEEHGGGYITVAHAAQKLGVSMPAVSRTLKNLQAKGYINRHTDETDRRSVRISVTDSGRQALRRCMRQSVEILSEALEQFTDEELHRMIDLHQRFTDSMADSLARRSKEKQT